MAEWKLSDAERIRAELTKAQEDEISMLYRKVYLDVRKQMLAIPKDGTVSQQIERQYLDKLHKQLDEAYKSLGIGLEKQLKKDAKKAAESTMQESKKLVKKAGFKFEGLNSKVPKDVVNFLVTGKLYGGNWSLSGAIWADIKNKQADISKVIAEGVSANKSAYSIAKDLEKYVDPSAKKEWDWNRVYPGTAKKVEYNSQRLARTMISHAYQQSLERTCKNNPFVTGYIWQSAHSGRVCPLCRERNGTFFKKGDLPLDHPNGMCTFIAKIDGSMMDISNRLANWATGGDDPALDKWMADLSGKKMEPVFNDLQNKWLKPLGYSPTNMPKDFKEFMDKMSISQHTDFLTLAGGTWSLPHPYQFMEAYYKHNLAVVRQGLSPIAKKEVVKGIFDGYDWRAMAMTQNVADMLELEKSTLQGALNSREINALRHYTGSAYREMNGFLRDVERGLSNEAAMMSSGLDDTGYRALVTARNALDKTSIGKELILNRGTDFGDLAGFLPGDFYDNMRILEQMTIEELNDKFAGTSGMYAGFTSTSSLYDRGFSGEVEMIFHASEKVKGSSVMSISKYGTAEGETLLNAGTVINIVKIEASDGHHGSRIRVFAEIAE